MASVAPSRYVYFYLTLVRHGQTNANVDNIIQGHMDTELSSVGLAQAQALRQPFSTIPIDLLISSDLRRASVTAAELAPSLKPERDARLRERNFGRYCGASRLELQKFTQSNSDTGAGCDGWRAVGGECSHEMAQRTYSFLVDLCSRLSRKTTDSPSHVSSYPIFPNSYSKPIPESVAAVVGADKHGLTYCGHVVIISHGGWIRHFLRLLALKAERSWSFPEQCVNTVMRNCGICQVGVAFDPVKLDEYQKQSSIPVIHDTPLPVFGTLSESGGQTVNCPFYESANRSLPLLTMCYHFDSTISDIGSCSNYAKSNRASHPADQLCSKMEVIFSDDGDEYTGIPNASK